MPSSYAGRYTEQVPAHLHAIPDFIVLCHLSLFHLCMYQAEEHKTSASVMSLIMLAELACSISHSAVSFLGDGRTRAAHSAQYASAYVW